MPTAAGRYVSLSDVAEIGDGEAEQRGFARLNGRPVVAFQVNKTAQASDVHTEDGVHKAIAAIAKAHPEAQFTEVVSTVKDTRKSFTSTVDVLIEGMVLAALVVFVFLKSWRATADRRGGHAAEPDPHLQRHAAVRLQPWTRSACSR